MTDDLATGGLRARSRQTSARADAGTSLPRLQSQMTMTTARRTAAATNGEDIWVTMLLHTCRPVRCSPGHLLLGSEFQIRRLAASTQESSIPPVGAPLTPIPPTACPPILIGWPPGRMEKCSIEMKPGWAARRRLDALIRTRTDL